MLSLFETSPTVKGPSRKSSIIFTLVGSAMAASDSKSRRVTWKLLVR